MAFVFALLGPKPSVSNSFYIYNLMFCPSGLARGEGHFYFWNPPRASISHPLISPPYRDHHLPHHRLHLPDLVHGFPKLGHHGEDEALAVLRKTRRRVLPLANERLPAW